MTNDDKVSDEKLQYDIIREVASEETLPSKQRQIIPKANFAYSPLGNSFEKQTEEQVGALKYIDISNKKDELKQIQVIFSKNLMNDLICVKLKEIVKLQDINKKDDLNY